MSTIKIFNADNGRWYPMAGQMIASGGTMHVMKPTDILYNDQQPYSLGSVQDAVIMTSSGSVLSRAMVEMADKTFVTQAMDNPATWRMTIANGGIARNITMSGAFAVSDAMLVYVSSGGIFSSCSLTGAHQVFVSSGGCARDCFISGSGWTGNLDNAPKLCVISGGSSYNTIIKDAMIAVGGYASQIRGQGQGQNETYGGLLQLLAGGIAENICDCQCDILGGSALNISNCKIFMSGGIARNVVITERKSCFLLSRGAVIENITVQSGGSMAVYSGASALNVTSNTGASIDIHTGAYVTYV